MARNRNSGLAPAIIGGIATVIGAAIGVGGTLLATSWNNSSNNEIIALHAEQTQTVKMQPTIDAQATTIVDGAQQMKDTGATSAAIKQQASEMQGTATALEQKVGELTSQMSLERRGYIFQEVAEKVIIEAENYSYMLPGSDSEGSR